jgi:hypothetical protein
MTSPTAKMRAPSMLMAPSKIAQTPEGALGLGEETRKAHSGKDVFDNERRGRQ